MRAHFGAGLSCGLLAIAACAGHAKVAAAPAAPLVPTRALVPDESTRRALAPARSHYVGNVVGRSIGPFVASSPSGKLAAWVGPEEGSAVQKLIVVPLADDGSPLRAPRAVATLPREPTGLVLQAAGGAKEGWLLLWTALLDRGESVTVQGLAPDGSPRGLPSDLQRTSDHIGWSKVVSTGQTAVCLWTEETTAGPANVLAAVVTSDGQPVGMPVRVARNMRRWEAVPAGDGVGLALVPDSPGVAGTLSWLRLDALGRPVGSPLAVTTRPTVSSDIDVVPWRGRWLLGWTDRTGEDAQVVLATVDPTGRVEGPRVAMDTVGGSVLVALAGGAGGAALAWEEPHARARVDRTLHLASVGEDADLAAHSVTALRVAPAGRPDFVAEGSGFALIAPARVCRTRMAPGSCAGPVAPTFVRLDERLDPVQAEPLLVGEDNDPAALAWGLLCQPTRCTALAAAPSTPTPFFSVQLVDRTSPFVTPALAPSPPDAPRATGVATVASGAPFIDLSAARLGDATILAALTVDGPLDRDRTKAHAGGALSVRVIDAQARALAPPWTLTSRAAATGGVSVASSGSPSDGAAVAWVKRHDDGAARVHVARIDRQRGRGEEVEVDAKGDPSSVAIAWAGDGWLVAWVEARDGNGQVYAAKLDHDLHRKGPTQRVTSVAGAADVAVAVRGDVVWLAWSDSRDSLREGLGDIFVTTLRARDAKRLGEETRVLSTAAHSRSPQIAPTPDGGALIAWIEDAPPGLEGAGTPPEQHPRVHALATTLVARVDSSVHVVGAPARLRLSGEEDGGRPITLALVPAGEGARAIVAHSAADCVTLDAVILGPNGQGAPWPLVDLDAPPSFEVGLALTPDAVFFDDVGVSGASHRVRRAAVSWGSN
ncbi:MAG TPA: hypothetical protein VKU41_26345 [Polyangiaceae bacterium]|nr:hypothetical protein [Polyangiaceae bacterium]